MSWNSLESIDRVAEIESLSFSRPQLIFKHSTRCGISSYAEAELNGGLSRLADKIELHYLDLLQYRSVSNHIASEFGVPHQSPQIIVLENGKAQFSLSHSAISVKRILELFTK